MKIIDNAKIAQSVWDSFAKNKSNRRIQRFFHLRPTNSGITIVTTLDGYEMRGIVKHSGEELANALSEIADYYPILVSLNDIKKNEKMKNLGFPKRERTLDSALEEFIQATMIDTMSEDSGLAKVLGVQNMQFITSELIFEKGHHRVDIVGFDGIDLYFFELKRGRTLKIAQVSDYVKYYSEAKNNITLKELLETYPINPIKHFQSIKGVMVMKYAENSESRYKWVDEQKKHNIDILFYRHSFSYKRF